MMLTHCSTMPTLQTDVTGAGMDLGHVGLREGRAEESGEACVAHLHVEPTKVRGCLGTRTLSYRVLQAGVQKSAEQTRKGNILELAPPKPTSVPNRYCQLP